jgi:hypothetical protein
MAICCEAAGIPPRRRRRPLGVSRRYAVGVGSLRGGRRPLLATIAILGQTPSPDRLL